MCRPLPSEGSAGISEGSDWEGSDSEGVSSYLIFWLYPVFGIRGASWFLGVSEWLFGALLFLGFWNKKAGMLGAIGSCVTFIGTVTIIPFMPNGWAASAGGFPAMAGNVPFLMKDIVLFAASVYLLKQDVMRVSLSAAQKQDAGAWVHSR